MLEIRDIRKDYKNFSLDCSFSVKPGQITGLIGQNGAGKSTTFKAMLGLISLDGGKISIFGKDITECTAEEKEKVGVVLSDSGFSGYLTIKDIIPILKNFYKDFNPDAFTKQVARFDLPFDKKIKEFSTGMRAKLKVLVALSHRAKLVIMDEPTVGLDVVARDELLSMIREYMEEDEDRSILISSHISSDLETICDDLYMIHEGKVILHEDTDVLLDDYAVLKISKSDFEHIDKDYVLYYKEEPFGYSCLTNQRQFYMENYPKIVIEKGTIDSIMTMMIKGVRK